VHIRNRIVSMLRLLKPSWLRLLKLLDIPTSQNAKWGPNTKISLLNYFNYYRDCAKNNETVNLSETGFRVFSQFEEDGILLAIFGIIGMKNKIFVDIGSGNGINSNCANLAINFGWNGLFIDGSKRNIQEGSIFYNRHPDTFIFPPKFKQAFIQRENINQLIENEGFAGDVDLLSVDIDGNDYWIWDALNIISPNVVIIETHVEFGLKSIVVPYDKDYFFPGKHPDYHGASPIAMNKLAIKKGYRLVGSNIFGFNTIYIKKELAVDILPTVSVEEILKHPRNLRRYELFEDIKDWDYIKV
jgi:hypothetical protein